MKAQAVSLGGHGMTVGDARSVAGLGDETYVVYSSSNNSVAGISVGTSAAHLLVVDGNASLTIDYEVTAL